MSSSLAFNINGKHEDGRHVDLYPYVNKHNGKHDKDAGGEFKRFGTISGRHGIESPHVHQPKVNVDLDGIVEWMGDYHSFPESVDAFCTEGKINQIIGGDKIPYKNRNPGRIQKR